MLLYTICSLTLIYNYCFINRIEKKELKAKSIVILAFIFTYVVSFTSVFYLYFLKYILRASLVAQLVKNLPAMQETPVQFLGWKDPLEKG